MQERHEQQQGDRALKIILLKKELVLSPWNLCLSFSLQFLATYLLQVKTSRPPLSHRAGTAIEEDWTMLGFFLKLPTDL